MLRTSKRYVITTSGLNCYSYRVMSAGVDFSQYQNNPLLLWMHTRANGADKNQILPLGRVVEIRLEGDAWTGQPEFDESDTFALSIYRKYEAGVLNMLSLGALPLEISTDPKYMLEGQQNPTVLSCLVTDISCVDIGGNPQALPVQLYDERGNKIELSNAGIYSYFQLAKNANKSRPHTDHKKATVDIVENGINAGKLTNKMADTLLAMPTDEQSVEQIHHFVKAAKIDAARLEGKIPNSLLPDVTKSYDEIKNGYGGFNDMKAHAPEVYKAKFFEKHGRLPAQMK